MIYTVFQKTVPLIFFQYLWFFLSILTIFHVKMRNYLRTYQEWNLPPQLNCSGTLPDKKCSIYQHFLHILQ